MSTDDRIREEFQSRTEAIDHLDVDERSLFGMLFRVFTGSLRRWAALAMAMTLVFVGLTVWTGYGFFTATDADARVFWGVLALASFHAVSMFKIWFFMEMNRHSTLREIKRVELEVARLPRR